MSELARGSEKSYISYFDLLLNEWEEKFRKERRIGGIWDVLFTVYQFTVVIVFVNGCFTEANILRMIYKTLEWWIIRLFKKYSWNAMKKSLRKIHRGDKTVRYYIHVILDYFYIWKLDLARRRQKREIRSNSVFYCRFTDVLDFTHSIIRITVMKRVSSSFWQTEWISMNHISINT